MNVQKAGSNQGASARPGGGGTLPNEFDIQTALLPGFTDGRLLRILIQFDVPTKRQPLVQLPVMNQ